MTKKTELESEPAEPGNPAPVEAVAKRPPVRKRRCKAGGSSWSWFVVGGDPPAAIGERIVEAMLLRRRLAGFHIDHLHAAVGRIHRRVRILRLGLAVADGDEVASVDAVLLAQITLDGVGATL